MYIISLFIKKYYLLINLPITNNINALLSLQKDFLLKQWRKNAKNTRQNELEKYNTDHSCKCNAKKPGRIGGATGSPNHTIILQN